MHTSTAETRFREDVPEQNLEDNRPEGPSPSKQWNDLWTADPDRAYSIISDFTRSLVVQAAVGDFVIGNKIDLPAKLHNSWLAHRDGELERML